MTNSNILKFLITGLKISIFLGASIFFYHYANGSISNLSRYQLGIWQCIAILLLGLFYCSLVGWAGLVWALVLKGQGCVIGVSKPVIIYCFTQFAKYLPGNFMHHLGRISMAKEHGIDIKKSTSSLGVEIFSLVFVSLLCSFVYLFYFGRLGDYFSFSVFFQNTGLLAIILGSLMLVATLLFCKKSIQFIIKKLSIVEFPSVMVLVLIFGGYFLFFVGIGILNSLLVIWVFDAPLVNPLVMTGAFALAWVVGFVTPGAPGGLGVREAVLLTSLGPLLGTEVAAGLSIVLRVVTTLGDGIAFFVAMVFVKKIRKKNTFAI